MYTSHFAYLFICWWTLLDVFHLLAIVTNAAVNRSVQVSVYMCFSWPVRMGKALADLSLGRVQLFALWDADSIQWVCWSTDFLQFTLENEPIWSSSMTQSLRQMSPVFPSHLSPFLLIPHLPLGRKLHPFFCTRPSPHACSWQHYVLTSIPPDPSLPHSPLPCWVSLSPFSFFSLACKCAKNSPVQIHQLY